MENFYKEATQYTPDIRLDAQKGLIEIRGKSYPENTFEFYKPMLAWINEYLEHPAEKTTVKMEIVYFNSSSSKLFFDLFDLMEEKQDKSEMDVWWIYDEENESAQEAGEEFIEDFDSLPIRLVPKKTGSTDEV